MKCDYCKFIEGEEPVEVIFQDEDVFVFVAESAISPGQITLIPKHHYPIYEQTPKKLLRKISDLINQLSISIFEGLQVHGTNILIQNGLGAGQSTPHFSLEIIPRKMKDGLDLQWEPQKVEEFDIDDSLIQIQSLTEGLTIEDHDKETIVVDGEKSEAVLEKSDDEENYLLKSLRKRP